MQEVFTDTPAMKAGGSKRTATPWLGLLDANSEELAVNDVRWMIDDARKSASMPAEDVAGLRKQIAGLTTAHSGLFFNYDGTELPW